MTHYPPCKSGCHHCNPDDPQTGRPKKKISRKEQKLLYKATHKYLCPQCEKKTPKQLMLENMFVIPFLVKTKCSKCGFEGMLVEVPLNTGEQTK